VIDTSKVSSQRRTPDEMTANAEPGMAFRTEISG